jgi:hypothetical protein
MVYFMIFLALRARAKVAKRGSSSDHPPCRILTFVGGTGPRQSLSGPTSDSPATAQSGARHPAFLIYPLIYVLCTAPLALGRIATMAGIAVPLSYFCVAGALITSNGWLDVTLWSITRRELLYCAEVDREDVGLETFTFMRTPPDRVFGNIIWVEGGALRPPGFPGEATDSKGLKSWSWGSLRGWLRLSDGSAGGRRSVLSSVGSALGRGAGPRNVSQQSLRGRSEPASSLAIHLDTITSVEVEVDPGSKRVATRAQELRFPGRRPSACSGSDEGEEKDVAHRYTTW